jgi:uncharacterized protein (DUF2147 family)
VRARYRRRLGALALALLGALLLGRASAGVPSAVGVWKQIGDDGKVGALVTIAEEGGVFVGRLSHLYLEPGDDPNPVCNNCPGDKLNQPLLGLVFIEGMKQNGLDYEGGTILDPESGKTYRAKRRPLPCNRCCSRSR